MTLEELRNAIDVLIPYYNKTGWQIGCEHDQLYIFATSRPLIPEDLQKVIDCGFWQEDVDRGEDDEFEAKHYDPEEGWTTFV